MELENYIEGQNFSQLIDETHAMIKKELLPRLTLMPHQRAAIAQLMWAEYHYKMLGRRCSIYGDNLGSGKTRVVLGLVALQPVPPVKMPEVYDYDEAITAIVTSKNRPYMRQTLIIVKGDVFESWRAEILTCLPKAKVAYINNVRAYQDYLVSPTNEYDIIVAKAGKMSLHKGQATNIISELAEQIKQPFARVVIDDYEQLTQYLILPKALSYLAVSTTAAKINVSFREKNEFSYANLFNILADFNVMRNAIVRCKNDTLQKWLSLPLVTFRKVMIKSRYGFAMAFGKMDGEMGEIVSALAGDAYSKAGKLLGITAITPADVYQALLGKFYNRLNRANENLARLDQIVIKIKQLARSSADRPPFTREMGTAIRHWVLSSAKEMPHLVPAQGFSDYYKQLLAELQEELRAAKTEVDIVKESLAKQQCEVCNAEVGKDLAAVIVRCCSKMSCADCINKTFNFWKSRTKNYNVCPFNAQHRLNKNSIVYISEKMDLQLVASEEVYSTEELVQIEGELQLQNNKPPSRAELDSKPDAILKILAGEEFGELTEMEIEGLTKGEYYIQPPKEKKVIIFVAWEETIVSLIDIFRKYRIDFGVLCGTSTDIQKKIDTFKVNPEQHVLLINSDKHVSGFNLQFATDLVFYSKIRDKHVLSQAAGRIQRFGRDCSATIWELLYENE